jgi:RNA recognition motif-containing protein
LHVSDLPRTVGERDLYDCLARARLSPEDVYVHHVIQQPFRFAFIAFRGVPAAEDAIVEIGSHRFDGKRPRVGFFRPRDGETQPFQGRHAEPRCRNAGPSRNRASPPVPNCRDLTVFGIAPRSYERDLVDLIESKAGRGSIRSLQLEANSRAEDDRRAFIEMDKHDDALRALDRVDGLVFDGQAITVNWACAPASTHRAAAVDEQPGQPICFK